MLYLLHSALYNEWLKGHKTADKTANH